MVALTSVLRDSWVTTRAFYSALFCRQRADGSTDFRTIAALEAKPTAAPCTNGRAETGLRMSAFGGKAEMPSTLRACRSGAHDPQPTKAPSKSRTAVGLPQCYRPVRSTGEIAGETARFHHAARWRSGVAARGKGAADGDAGDWVPQPHRA